MKRIHPKGTCYPWIEEIIQWGEDYEQAIKEFQSWIETRQQENRKKGDIFAGSENYAISQKFEELFGVKA